MSIVFSILCVFLMLIAGYYLFAGNPFHSEHHQGEEQQTHPQRVSSPPLSSSSPHTRSSFSSLIATVLTWCIAFTIRRHRRGYWEAHKVLVSLEHNNHLAHNPRSQSFHPPPPDRYRVHTYEEEDKEEESEEENEERGEEEIPVQGEYPVRENLQNPSPNTSPPFLGTTVSVPLNRLSSPSSTHTIVAPFGEKGKSFDFLTILQQDEAAFRILIQGYLMAIDWLYRYTGGRITRDGFVASKKSEPALARHMMTQKTWDYLIGPVEETPSGGKPGILRQAGVITVREGGGEDNGSANSEWLFESAHEAYTHLEPWLQLYIAQQRETEMKGKESIWN